MCSGGGGRESTSGGWEEREETLQGAGTGIVGTAMAAILSLLRPPGRRKISDYHVAIEMSGMSACQIIIIMALIIVIIIINTGPEVGPGHYLLDGPLSSCWFGRTE